MTEPEKPPLNLGRVVLVFALLPVVLGLDRWASFGARSVLSLLLSSGGFSSSDYRSFVTLQGVLASVTVLIGGAVAIATGPAVTLALGAALSTLGYGVLAASSGATGIWAGLALLALGQGLLRPSAFALAAVELAHPRSHLRSAACVVLYAVTNVSALLSSPVAGLVADRGGVRAAFGSFGLLAALATFLAFLFLVLWYLLRAKPDPKAAPPEPAVPVGRVALGAGLLILALAPYHLMISLQSSVTAQLAYSTSSAAAAARLYSLNPVAVLCTVGLALPVLVAAHLRQARSFSLFAIGAGLCLTAFAVIPILLAKTSFAAMSATELTVGAAEILVGPIALSRIAGDLPPRFVAVAVALYQCVGTVAGLLAGVALRAFRDSGLLLCGATALVVLVVGAALLGAAAPLGRAFHPPLRPPR